jgi:prepilin-type N-terminal cleavage/methylation domain-containing protein
MRNRWSKSSKRPPRRARAFRPRSAMTLIEVMAGMVILGTILSSLVVARSRYLHQWTLAGRKQAAVSAADSLLSNWWASPTRLPVNSSGNLNDQNLKWKTHVIPSESAQTLSTQIVRLEIFDNPQGADSAPSATPLAYVDVVLPTTEPSGKTP